MSTAWRVTTAYRDGRSPRQPPCPTPNPGAGCKSRRLPWRHRRHSRRQTKTGCCRRCRATGNSTTKPNRVLSCFGPHRPNYFLPLKYSNSPNNTPFQDQFTQPDLGLDSLEAELQLSFKIKGMEGVFGHDNRRPVVRLHHHLVLAGLQRHDFLAVPRNQLRTGSDPGCFARITRSPVFVAVSSTWGWCTSRMGARRAVAQLEPGLCAIRVRARQPGPADPPLVPPSRK